MLSRVHARHKPGEVKKPDESSGPYDYYKLLPTIPADTAFRPIDQGDCPLVAKK